LSGQHISFLIPASLKAGLKEGDRLLSINGRPLIGNAVFGEELRKAHPGDVMNVTVSRRENGTEFTATYAVPLVSREGWAWKDRSVETILLIILPYLAVLAGFWVAIVRPRDPRAWLVLAITGSYLGIGRAGAEQWQRYVRDLAVAFHGAVVNAFPIWLFCSGSTFRSRFRKRTNSPAGGGSSGS